MSSAGRGERLGGPHDDYPTPSWCVERLLEKWKPYSGLLVEPAAGDGAIIRVVNSVLTPGEVRWLAIEVCSECEEPLLASGVDPAFCIIGDFFSEETPVIPGATSVSAVITNPPYALAQSYVERSRRLYSDAETVMLLRVGFLSSEERIPFYQACGVPDIYILPNRPSYRGAVSKKTGKEKSGTDSTDYAWFIWPPRRRKTGKLILLNSTSLEARRQEKRGRTK